MHLSLFKGVVLIHLVYLFHEAENVKKKKSVSVRRCMQERCVVLWLWGVAVRLM